MDIREIIGIDRVQGGNATHKSGGTRSFADLLQELQSAVKTDTPTKVEGVGDLADAMQRAEQDYSSLMDLRRKLEDAWRNHLS